MISQTYIPEFALKLSEKTMPLQDKKPSSTSEKPSQSFDNFLTGAKSRASGMEKSFVQKRTMREDFSGMNSISDRTDRPVRDNRDIVTRGATLKRQESMSRSKKTADGPLASGELKTENKLEDKEKVSEGALLQAMAQVLGIGQDELEKLLKSAGIEMEELLDGSKSTDITEKLAGCLELDENQKKLMQVILDISRRTVTEHTEFSVIQENSISDLFDETVQSNVKQADGMEKAEKVAIPIFEEPVDSMEDGASLEDIVKSLRQRMQGLVDRLQKDPQQAISEITECIETAVGTVEETGKTSLKLEATPETKTDTVSEPKVERTQDTGESNLSDAGQPGSDSMTSQQEESFRTAAALPFKESTSMESTEGFNLDKSLNRIDAVAASPVRTNDAPAEPMKVYKEQNVPKQEIIHQIVEKAKVVITGEKSEMVMELKPEHLGKVSLKVLTEQGVVIAKFIAESQQVKQVLEANMQLLKDSLEKQGLMVQDFSVSVRQDSSGNTESGNKREEGKRKALPGQMGDRSNVSGIGAVGRNISVNNYYNWSESSINLTA